MKLEKINLLIDAYQDGEIEKNDAIELADLIRSGGAQSEWVMKELEMRGLIAHIFEDASPSRFVQSLMERFKAEGDAINFEQDFEKRLKLAQRSQPNTKHAEIKQALSTVGSATESAGLQKKYKKLKVSIAFVASAFGLILLWAFNTGLLAREVASLETSQNGLRLHRNNEDIPLQESMSLYAGDRLSFLGHGKTTLRLKNQSKVDLIDETSLVLNLKSDILDREHYSSSQSIFLERGKLFIESKTNEHDIVVWTPHSIVRLYRGSLEILSSDLTTMLIFKDSSALLGTISTGAEKKLQGDQVYLVNDVGQIEELTHKNKKGY